MKTFEQRKQTVTRNILKALNDKFPHVQPEEDFETIWPLSEWDTIRTETRTFNVHLKLATGQVLSIEEEV